MNTNPQPDQHPRDEVEAAFRQYFLTGPVREDWIAWSQLFTDDAVYFDHFYGRFHGPHQIQLFLESTMMFRWRSEEDWWIQSEMKAFAKGYWKACQAIDPDFPDRLSRAHWGDIDWARPEPGHVATPSWLGREHEVPAIKRVEDMDFGERV